MALSKSSNAEVGIWSAEGWSRLTTNNEVVRDNSVTPHGGSWSWLVAGDGIQKNSWLPFTSAGSLHWWIIRLWLRVGNLPTSAEDMALRPQAGASSPLANLVLNTNGTLSIGASGNGYAPTFSPALTIGQWYKLEGALAQSGSTQAWVNAIWRLNDVEIGRYIGRPNSGAFTRFQTSAAPSIVARQNADDIVVNDDTGSTAIYWNDADKPRSTGRTIPTVRSTATPIVGSTQVASVVVNQPSSVVAGDLLVAVIELQNQRTITSLPTGWTLIVDAPGSAGGVAFASKVATASEPSSYTFGLSSNSRSVSGCYALTEVDSSTPVIEVRTVQVSTGGSAQAAFPALDLSAGDALILQAVSNGVVGVTVTPPAWWSSVSQAKDTTNGPELAAGVYASTDGGLSVSDVVALSATVSNAGTSAIAFRGALPQTVAPTGIASAQAFGTATVIRGGVSLRPSGIASAQALGTPTVTPGAVSVAPSGIASAQALGTLTVRASTLIAPSGIVSAQALGTPTVRPGPVVVQPTGIASAQAFGATRIAFKVQPAGIASGQAFGVAVVAIKKVIRPTGIPSAEVWGRKQQMKVVRRRATTAIITPSGIVSAQAVGHPTVSTGVVFVRPVGIAGAEAFGLGGIGRPVILPAPTGTGPLPPMLVRRSGLRR